MNRAVFILRPVSDVGLGGCTSGVGEEDCFFFLLFPALFNESDIYGVFPLSPNHHYANTAGERRKCVNYVYYVHLKRPLTLLENRLF